MKLEGISVTLICDLCNLTFTDSTFFADHCKSAHPLSPSTHTVCFVCHICSDTFESNVELKSHLHVKHMFKSNDAKSEKLCAEDVCQNCKFCGRIFRHPAILSMHSESCRKLHEQYFNGNEFCDYVSFDPSIEELSLSGRKRQGFAHCRGTARRGSHSSSYSRWEGPMCTPSVKESSLVCKYCPKTFSKKYQVNQHIKNCSFRHQNSETVINGNKTTSGDLFVKDILSKMGLKEERVACAYCVKSFPSKYEAILHVRKVHPAKVDEFVIWLERRKVFLRSKMCSICDKEFCNKEEADKHFESFHKDESVDKEWSCELCLVKYCSESELINHIADHDACRGGLKLNQAQKSLVSDGLPVTSSNPFLSLPSVEMEVKQVGGFISTEEMDGMHKKNLDLLTIGSESAFECSSFKIDINSQTDQSIDTPSVSFKDVDPANMLEPVNFQFEPVTSVPPVSDVVTERQPLFNHKSYSTYLSNRPFICRVCEKAFIGKASLYMHSKSHRVNLRHSCEYCLKRFYYHRQLLSHLRTHSDEVRYHCRKCGKGFKARSKLVEHEQVHSYSKPYKCHVCNSSFIQKLHLENHLQYFHHGEMCEGTA